MRSTPLLISLALATVAVAPTVRKPVAPAAKPAAEVRTARYDWRRLGTLDLKTGKMIVAPERVPLPGEGC